MKKIKSTLNQKIKFASSLMMRKYRRETGAFIAEGARLVEMATDSEWDINFCLVSEPAMNSERIQAIVEKMYARGVDVFETSEDSFRKASATVNPQGILAVVERKVFSSEELENLDSPLIVALDGVQDPGNVGTIVRMADAAGCSAIIALSGTSDIFSEKSVRASMGSVFFVKIIENVNAEKFSSIAKKFKWNVFITSNNEQAQNFLDMDYKKSSAIIFGNEGNGISDELIKNLEEIETKKIFIPMTGHAESLNVASAASITLFEAFRQRAS